MALKLKRSAFLLAVVLLGGCEQRGIFGQQAPANPAVSQTGTYTVRQRVQQLRADQTALAGGIQRQNEQLNAARSQINSDTSTYQGLVSSMTARLQPGNPELVQQWNESQGRLDAITLVVGQLNSLASQVTTQASVAGYIVDNVRATYSVGGAVEEDHRNLRSIESDASRSIQDVARLIGNLNAEISCENGFLARERSNLAALSYSINVGRLGNPGMLRGPSLGPMRRRVVLGPGASDAPIQLSAAQD